MRGSINKYMNLFRKVAKIPNEVLNFLTAEYTLHDIYNPKNRFDDYAIPGCGLAIDQDTFAVAVGLVIPVGEFSFLLPA